MPAKRWSIRAVIEEVLRERGAARLEIALGGEPDEAAPVIIPEHRETLRTLEMADRWAQKDLAILITGETGTGKDLLARYVRWMSPRRLQPFVTIDLNTIPETLWESELFGHRKGTFTGAAEKMGLLETVDGGTVFLNEIGNLPLDLQTKLLEFLDNRQVCRLGDARPKTLDVRFIAATNTALTEAVAGGHFRADLYYRLKQAPLHLLPLRHHRNDIPPLLRHFLVECEVDGNRADRLLAQEWVKRAMDLHWPGNIRELRDFTQRLVALAGSTASAREFAAWADRLVDHMQDGDGPAGERERLLDALRRCDWNQRAAARDLRVSESGLRHQMQRLKISRPR